MPEFYQFLKDCIKRKNTNFEFIVNTNAVKISKTLLNLGKQFDNLQYIVSIDGYECENDYSRWPSNWNVIIENINKLIKNKHQVIFNITVSIYTVFSFYKLVQFLQEKFPQCLIHAQLAVGKFLNPFVLKFDSQLIYNTQQLQNTYIYKGDELFSSFVDGLITQMKRSLLDKTQLKRFFEFNDRLDQSRCVKLIDYIPELESYRNEC